MNAEWIGRRLVQASSALADRFVEQHPHAVLAPLTAELLARIGEAIAAGDLRVRRPLAHTRVPVRLPTTLELTVFAAEYKALVRLVRTHLAHLPGITPEQDRYARASLQHAARALVDAHRRLAAGEPLPAQTFGGVVLVEPVEPPATRDGRVGVAPGPLR